MKLNTIPPSHKERIINGPESDHGTLKAFQLEIMLGSLYVFDILVCD